MAKLSEVFRGIQITEEYCNPGFRQVEMKFGLVHASYSLSDFLCTLRMMVYNIIF